MFDKRQYSIDKANMGFWDELCGTTFARALGIKDVSKDSLKHFDKAYFNFYPYLFKYVPLDRMAGKKVLEVGLGYGSLGQKIAEAGADYLGLDIAQGPVNMMNYRLNLNSLSGKAVLGNILESGLASEFFDYVISIGVFHHTGDVQRCIDETYRLLKPKGLAAVMVYNQFSLKQWLRWPYRTLINFLYEKRIYGKKMESTEKQKLAYDANHKGEAAPEVTFASIREMKYKFRQFSSLQFNKENFFSLPVVERYIPSRIITLPTFGCLVGSDIYIQAYK